MSYQKDIDNIMDWFDFNKVQKAMQALDWQWATSEYGVPEEPELRETARKYLQKTIDYAVAQGRKHTMATGGFVYTYDPEYSELTLTFEVTSWTATENDSEGFF